MDEMTNAETADWMTNHASLPRSGFSWPSDLCGYNQHIRFVEHRNKNWTGSSQAEWNKFVLDYAAALRSEPVTIDHKLTQKEPKV